MNNQTKASPAAIERAREIADRSIDARVCCDKYPPCQTELWRIALALDIAAALTAAASEARATERERLGFGKIVMMSEQRNRPGQPPHWCALARGSKVAATGDSEEEARLRALATPAQSEK